MAGTFITFEGVEGSGKSTQLSLLAERLEGLGISVARTREPGGTDLGEGIRRLVLDPSQEGIDPVAELLLMEAARAQHVAGLVRPALEEGRVVLCDRFIDSTLVYQGFARGLRWEMVEDLNRMATGDLVPDTTILLDLDVSLGLERATRHLAGGNYKADGSIKEGATEARFEMEGAAFHERVRAGYLRLAKDEPDRVKVVRATGSPEEVHERVWKALEKTLEAVVPCG